MCSSRKRRFDKVEEVVEEDIPSKEELVEKFESFYGKVTGKKELKFNFYIRVNQFFQLLRKDAEARREIARKIDVKFLSALLCRYKATQSHLDLCIFDLLQFIEQYMNVNLKTVAPMIFSSKASKYYEDLITYGKSLSNVLRNDQVLEYLEKEKLQKTTSSMVHCEFLYKPMEEFYDARFVLMLLGTLVRPGSDLSCKKFITSGALNFLITSLSFSNPDLRCLAYRTLSDYLKLLNDLSAENFDERVLVIYLIRVLRQSIGEPNQRIPSPVTRFLCEAVTVSLNPLDPMFKGIWSALLQKPFINLSQLPEFIKFFFSTSLTNHNKERDWILNIAVLSIQNPSDYAVLKHSHVLEPCMASFTTPIVHKGIKLQFLKLFKACLRYPTVAKDLTVRLNFPTWIAYAMKHSTTTRFEHKFLCQLFVTILKNVQEGSDGSVEFLLGITLKLAAHKILKTVKSVDDEVKNLYSALLEDYIKTGKITFKQDDTVKEESNGKIEENGKTEENGETEKKKKRKNTQNEESSVKIEGEEIQENGHVNHEIKKKKMK